jgi:hypothetical protein
MAIRPADAIKKANRCGLTCWWRNAEFMANQSYPPKGPNDNNSKTGIEDN